MNNEQIQSTTSTKKPWHKFISSTRKRQHLLIAVVAILTVSTGVLLWYIKNKQNVAPQLAVREVSFDEKQGDRITAEHLLQGGGAGTGLKFSRPDIEFLYIDSPFDGPDPRLRKDRKETIVDTGFNLEMGQRIVNSQKTVYQQALIAAQIVTPKNQPVFSSFAYFKQKLNKLVFPDIKDPTKLGMSLGLPQSFTNEHIKSDASIYEVKATILDENIFGLPYKSVKGELIEVKTKNANYYLLVVAVDKNWDSSPKSWKVIKDSLQVDQ